MRLNIMLMMTAIMIVMIGQMDMRRRPLHCKKYCDQEKKQRLVKAVFCHVDAMMFMIGE